MITVFTPIFNRVNCIPKLYKSLKSQTCKDFEWIVVDDGSTDGIEQVIAKWIAEETGFNIIYMKVKNAGKMNAVNKGVRLASSAAFFIVDSDDYLTDDAIELLTTWFEEIQDDDSFAGVSGLKRIKNIDVKHEFEYIDATNLERYKYNLNMDMAECYKTDILKKYPSPEIKGENYISPSIIWNRIALDGYKLRWYNRVIYTAEYLPDGLTKAGMDKLVKNPISWGQSIQLNIKCKADSEYIEFQYYLYYKSLKSKLKFEQICEYLGVNQDELKRIIVEKPIAIKRMKEYFYENKIKYIALYGMGVEAKKFIRISDELGVELCYGIDQYPNSLLPICYQPTDKLPDVDAILITNLRGSSEIRESLKKVTDIRCVSLQEDILKKGFRYYYSDI